MTRLALKEEKAFLDRRESRIRHLLDQLRGRHQLEQEALKRRIRAGLDELTKDRLKEQKRLAQKFQNLMSELRTQQEKDLRRDRGEFKSRASSRKQLSSAQKSRVSS